jgi:hypothetical protein
MGRTLSVDSNNDLFIGANGSLSTSDGIQATLQAAQQAAQTQLAEMIYAVDQGLPNFDVVWNGAPNLAQFDAYLRRAILAVDGVTAINELEVASAAGKLTYRAVIVTIYGSGAING